MTVRIPKRQAKKVQQPKDGPGKLMDARDLRDISRDANGRTSARHSLKAEVIWMIQPAKPLEQQLVFDLGHRGDVDCTQIAKMLAMTPAQRWRRYQRWRQLLRKLSVMPPLLDEIVTRLAQAQVEYVIVGGVSAILQGAPINTFDLDLCYRRTRANISRLVAALCPLNPRPRGFPADLPFTFDERTIQLGSNFTFDVGEEDLDLLGEMAAIGGYEQIIGQAVDMVVAGYPVKVLSLEQLIATKEAVGREKDRLALPVLKAALEIKKKRDPGREEPRPRGSDPG